MAEDGGALAVEHIRHHYSVRDAGFILDAHEQEPFCRAGALPADDAARDAYDTTVAVVLQPVRRNHSDGVHVRAMERHGMPADGEVSAAEIGVEPLRRSHRREGGVVVGSWL